MSKGNSGLLSKFQTKIAFSATGDIGDPLGYEVLKEKVIRVRIDNATTETVFSICGKIATDPEWSIIKTITGFESTVVNISTWDYIRFECDVYDSSNGGNILYASAFFEDGELIVEAVNQLEDLVSKSLLSIDSRLCSMEEELVINNKHNEIMSDEEF
jgi:hypothetical protein